MRNSKHLLSRQVFWTTTVLVLAFGGDENAATFQAWSSRVEQKSMFSFFAGRRDNWYFNYGCLETTSWCSPNSIVSWQWRAATLQAWASGGKQRRARSGSWHLGAHQTWWFMARKSCNTSGLSLLRQTEKSTFRFLTSWCSPNLMVHGEEELQHFRLEPLAANREECVQVLDILVLTKLDGSWRGRAATLQAWASCGKQRRVCSGSWHLGAHQTWWFMARKSCNTSGLSLLRQTEKSVFRFLTSWCSPNLMVHGEEELQHFRLEPLAANRRACSGSLLAAETITTFITVACKPNCSWRTPNMTVHASSVTVCDEDYPQAQ